MIDLPDGVICNIAMYAYDTTLCSKGDEAFGLWQQICDTQDTVDWGRKWLVDFIVRKT